MASTNARHKLPDALATGAPEESAGPAPGRLGTGLQWLDLILKGGIPSNRVYLVMGEPGTGKTTLALQFLLEGVANGERVLYITLAETREELITVAKSHEMDLSPIEIFEVLPTHESVRPEKDYTALHPSEIELGESLDRIVEMVERVKPTRVVIDSLTEIRLLAREQVRYPRQILTLKNFLMNWGCTVLFIDDPASRDGREGQLDT